jgi:hypothetical protein
MALRGIGFFDTRGQYFRTPDEATISDLAAILGRIGEGEGLTQGIAKTLLEKRGDIERLFSDHDAMKVSGETGSNVTVIRKVS